METFVESVTWILSAMGGKPKEKQLNPAESHICLETPGGKNCQKRNGTPPQPPRGTPALTPSTRGCGGCCRTPKSSSPARCAAPARLVWFHVGQSPHCAAVSLLPRCYAESFLSVLQNMRYPRFCFLNATQFVIFQMIRWTFSTMLLWHFAPVPLLKVFTCFCFLNLFRILVHEIFCFQIW